tara:strand:+ start:604 stop:1944 length:1341 start_codon:yes stop_codon:yes gene_type:complete
MKIFLFSLVLVQQSFIFCSEISFSPIFKYYSESQGGHWSIDSEPIYTMGAGLEYIYINKKLKIRGSFTNNRFFGIRSVPNKFNSIQGIAWSSTHDLSGEKFDYDISLMELSYIDDNYNINIGTFRHQWDPAKSSIIISNKSPNFSSIGFNYKISNILNFKYLHGRLKSNVSDESRSDLYGGKFYEESRYLVGHQLELFVNDLLNVRFGELVVYGNRSLELAYLMPFMPFWSTQHYLGDLDNLQWNLVVEYTPFESFNLFGTVIIDELSPGIIFEKNNRNWIGWQFGFNKKNFLLNKSNLNFEYSWTDHRIYRHRFPINDYYSWGYPIGFWAGPHAQEFYIDYNIEFDNNLISISYSDAKRGELSEQMMIDQYQTRYYDRFSNITENKKSIIIKYIRKLNKKVNVELGFNYIDWKNAGFNPFDSNQDISQLKNLEKKSLSINILYNY